MPFFSDSSIKTIIRSMAMPSYAHLLPTLKPTAPTETTAGAGGYRSARYDLVGNDEDGYAELTVEFDLD